MVLNKARLYQIFKYSVFVLLIGNAAYYFYEGLRSVSYTYENGVGWGDIIVAYDGAIDTAAWIILLIILELETEILDDNVLTGPVWWGLAALSWLCYIFIVYSVYGYWSTTSIPGGFEAYAGPDPCGLIAQGSSFVKSLDDYVLLDSDNCALLGQGALYNQDLNMVASAKNFDVLNRLAWLDVVNSVVWLVVVSILQLEVYLQSSRLFGTKFFTAYKYAKIFFYVVLAICAYYWLRLGDGVGAWDAFLWLVAFFFIEMNVLSWQEETAHANEGVITA